jgi:Winged helix-turn helix
VEIFLHAVFARLHALCSELAPVPASLSPQRPLHRAYRRDPEAIERWEREEGKREEGNLPGDREQAEAAGAVIYFADEAGVRSDYHAGTTWAPAGQTPV